MVFTGDRYDEFYWDTTYIFSGDNAENYFSCGHTRIHKERNLYLSNAEKYSHWI